MTTTLTPPRILTVDDDPIVRADLRVILEDAGFSVVPDARDGAEAVEHAREHAPDLIVLDLGLPGLDGFGAAATIRRASDVPIVALTGHSAPDMLKRASDAGADSYVLKPFSEAGLLATIREALAARSERVEDEADSLPPALDGRVDGAGEPVRAGDHPRDPAGRGRHEPGSVAARRRSLARPSHGRHHRPLTRAPRDP